MMRMSAVVIALGVLSPAIAAAQQEVPQQGVRMVRPLLRLEGGSLAPDDPTLVTLSVGASAGFEWDGRFALMVRWTRQEQSGSTGIDPTDEDRRFLTVNVEAARWPAETKRAQLRLRAGGGVMMRPDFATAGVATFGATVRYALTETIGFAGVLEDNVTWLKREAFQSCQGSWTCTTWVQGGYTQHNWGGFIALEWRP